MKEYVEVNQEDLFTNIFFLRAEDIAKESAMAKFDLLTQEALVSDIADWLIIFAESTGSFCELGAFAALPSSVSITSVVVDKKYRGSHSFLMNGPVRVIDECDAPLSKVFFSNLNCPMENGDFTATLHSIRECVKQNEEFSSNEDRKKLNSDATKVRVGSFAHEILDLIDLFGPIDEETLLELYCRVKRFNKSKFRLVSQTMSGMKADKRIGVNQVLAAMHATGLIGTIDSEENMSLRYYSCINLDNYFMFKQTKDLDFNNMRARVLLERRKRNRFYESNFYKRFNAK